jgi:hypothetical protein
MPMPGRWAPAPRTAVPAVMPAPVGGMNTSAPLASMDPADAVYLYNAHSSNGGVRVRDGWMEWVAPSGDGDTLGEVRTIIPYGGSASDGSDAKLFCATPDGVYDVSTSGATATLVMGFGTASGRAGWCSFSNFQTAAGSFIALCDEENGYYLFTASTNTWAQVAAGAGAGQISGADPAHFVQVLNWKNRLWFVERNSARAWYLPVGQFAGTVSSFGFGSKFPQGGALAAIANWTVDGGSGVDDQFVAVSNAGDVGMYQGTDPSVAGSFNLRGYWNVGKVPPGRRFIWDAGGDLLVLSSRGLSSMVRLLSGSQSPTTPDFFLSYRVGNLIVSDMTSRLTADGWSVHLHPRRNMVIVTVPALADNVYHQYATYATGGAWSVYRDIPMLCQAAWGGELYFGTKDGRVCKHSGNRDAVLLDGTGTDITYSGCTAFSDLGAPGLLKRIGLVKATVSSQTSSPSIDVQVRWDFDLGEILTSPAGTVSAGSTFGTAAWDFAVWGGSNSVSGKFLGATGFGKRCAIAFRGSSSSDTTIVAFDLTVTGGGLL